MKLKIKLSGADKITNAAAGKSAGIKGGCVVCGKRIVYSEKAVERECCICRGKYFSNCGCEDGHFVCDGCHSAPLSRLLVPLLLKSGEKDPRKLLERVMRMPQVHIHGPEHHILTACVLLTAFHNCGGDTALEEALKEAVRRGKQVPGGACGYFGICGAAVGAGIYMSIVLKSSPLNKSAWTVPQKLVAACGEEIVKYGGPRCCKRTSGIAVETAVGFTRELLGVDMPLERAVCGYSKYNKECILQGCPFFPGKK